MSGRTALLSALLLTAWLCSSLPTLAAASTLAAKSSTTTPDVSLAPTGGPPTSGTTVSGSGYAAGEGIDVYFDTTDVRLVTADGSGRFSMTLTVPASATPGAHYVDAVGRQSGDDTQAPFTVRTNWPQLGFDAAGNGTNPFENVLSATNVAKLRERWSAPGTPGTIESTPAIAGGVVYSVLGKGVIGAFQAETGAHRWQKTLAYPGVHTLSGPAVSAGTVFVGSGADVYALSTATGSVKWKFTTGAKVFATPRVVGNVVYVGSDDGKLYALDAATGAMIWDFQTGNAIRGSAAVARGNVYIGSTDGKLYVVDAATGTELWSATIAAGNAVQASVVLGKGRVYAAAGSTVSAFRLTAPDLQWTVTVPGGVSAAPALDGDTLYVGDNSGVVSALNARDGTRDWVSSERQPIEGAAAVADGVLYVGGETSTYALHESDGAPLRTFVGDGSGEAVVTDGTLTVDTSDAVTRFALP